MTTISNFSRISRIHTTEWTILSDGLFNRFLFESVGISLSSFSGRWKWAATSVGGFFASRSIMFGHFGVRSCSSVLDFSTGVKSSESLATLRYLPWKSFKRSHSEGLLGGLRNLFSLYTSIARFYDHTQKKCNIYPHLVLRVTIRIYSHVRLGKWNK